MIFGLVLVSQWLSWKGSLSPFSSSPFFELFRSRNAGDFLRIMPGFCFNRDTWFRTFCILFKGIPLKMGLVFLFSLTQCPWVMYICAVVLAQHHMLLFNDSSFFFSSKRKKRGSWNLCFSVESFYDKYIWSRWDLYLARGLIFFFFESRGWLFFTGMPFQSAGLRIQSGNLNLIYVLIDTWFFAFL